MKCTFLKGMGISERCSQYHAISFYICRVSLILELMHFLNGWWTHREALAGKVCGGETIATKSSVIQLIDRLLIDPNCSQELLNSLWLSNTQSKCSLAIPVWLLNCVAFDCLKMISLNEPVCMSCNITF